MLASCWVDGKGAGDVQGQPQCRRKAMIVGLPFEAGRVSFELEGTLLPSSGMGEVVTAFGKSQEWSSCWKVILTAVLNRRGVLAAVRL